MCSRLSRQASCAAEAQSLPTAGSGAWPGACRSDSACVSALEGVIAGLNRTGPPTPAFANRLCAAPLSGRSSGASGEWRAAGWITPPPRPSGALFSLEPNFSTPQAPGSMTRDASTAVAALTAAKDIETLEYAIQQAAFLDSVPGDDRQKLRGERRGLGDAHARRRQERPTPDGGMAGVVTAGPLPTTPPRPAPLPPAAARMRLKKMKAEEEAKKAAADAASKNPAERSPHAKEVGGCAPPARGLHSTSKGGGAPLGLGGPLPPPPQPQPQPAAAEAQSNCPRPHRSSRPARASAHPPRPMPPPLHSPPNSPCRATTPRSLRPWWPSTRASSGASSPSPAAPPSSPMTSTCSTGGRARGREGAGGSLGAHCLWGGGLSGGWGERASRCGLNRVCGRNSGGCQESALACRGLASTAPAGRAPPAPPPRSTRLTAPPRPLLARRPQLPHAGHAGRQHHGAAHVGGEGRAGL